MPNVTNQHATANATTHLVSESSEDAEFAVRLESEDAQSRGNDVPLSLVVRSRNSLVGAVTFHRVLTTGQLVGQHSADGLVKDSVEGWMNGGNEMKEGRYSRCRLYLKIS